MNADAPALGQEDLGGAIWRVARLGLWLGLLWVLAAVVLELGASRVGEGKDTSFGEARREFTASWGGPIVEWPPSFAIRHDFTVQEVDPVLKAWVDKEKTENLAVFPSRVSLSADLRTRVQTTGALRIPAYEVRGKGRYIIRNDSGAVGPLVLTVARPGGAALVYDYTITVGGTPVTNARLDQEMVVSPDLQPGEERVVEVTLSTKGVERWQWNLSAWKDRILPKLEATLTTDTPRFSLLRFGIPHERIDAPSGSSVVFSANDLSADQDLGVNFATEIRELGSVGEIVGFAPLSGVLLLLAVAVWSQVREVRFAGFHYAFIVVGHTTWFLFLSYLVRYLGLAGSCALATALMLGLFAATVPPFAGRGFAWRVVLPYQLLLTVGFAATFLLPTLRGLALLALCFGVLVSVMVPLSRAQFSRWPVLRG